MADTVHYHLERMLPELEDLVSRELFTREEIQEIVRKRRDFEYLLKRHSTLKVDYLRYVEYETQLEEFRRSRKQVLVRKLQRKGRGWRLSLCDRSSAQRIMMIYERAVTKFKGDLDLWLRYAEYCRSQGNRRIKKVLMKALQLHSTVPGLWIYAAVWEAEQMSNVAAARALMQQGLRMCPKSETLWLEYFHMELIFAQKIKARRLILGVGEKPAITEAGEAQEGAQEGAVSDQGEEEDGKSKKKPSISHHAATCKIAWAVYKNAIAAIPNSLSFRQQFLEIVETIDVEQSEALEDEIYVGLRQDFETDEESWAWLARRHLVKAERKGLGMLEAGLEASKVFEEALQSVHTARMYEVYAQFLVSQLEKLDSQPETANAMPKEDMDRTFQESANALLELYKRAESAGVDSEALAEGQVSLLLRWGKIEEAREVTERSCKVGASTCGSSRMWTILLSLSTKHADFMGVDGPNQLAKLLKDSLKQANGEVKSLLQIVAEVQVGDKLQRDGLLQVLETMTATSTNRKQEGAEVASALVDWVLHAQGFQQARAVYNRIIAWPAPASDFLKSCIKLEASLLAAGNDKAIKQLRRLFHVALPLYGHNDKDLWLEYCSQERKAGNIEQANHAYWRAKKTLTDPSDFLKQYELLQ